MTTATRTQREYYNPSALMSAFNFCKHWARRTGLADTERVDRAFGYLMSGDARLKWAEYATTTERCDCPDHQFRGNRCKHQLSLLIAKKNDELMDRFLEAA